MLEEPLKMLGIPPAEGQGAGKIALLYLIVSQQLFVCATQADGNLPMEPRLFRLLLALIITRIQSDRKYNVHLRHVRDGCTVVDGFSVFTGILR